MSDDKKDRKARQTTRSYKDMHEGIASEDPNRDLTLPPPLNNGSTSTPRSQSRRVTDDRNARSGPSELEITEQELDSQLEMLDRSISECKENMSETEARIRMKEKKETLSMKAEELEQARQQLGRLEE